MTTKRPMDVDEEVYRKLKAKCALEGVTLKEGLEKAIEGWVK